MEWNYKDTKIKNYQTKIQQTPFLNEKNDMEDLFKIHQK